MRHISIAGARRLPCFFVVRRRPSPHFGFLFAATVSVWPIAVVDRSVSPRALSQRYEPL